MGGFKTAVSADRRSSWLLLCQTCGSTSSRDPDAPVQVAPVVAFRGTVVATIEIDHCSKKYVGTSPSVKSFHG